MQAFEQLALIWFGVLIAAYLANRTRLTPVLYLLAIGAVFVNLGILPHEPAEFVRGFAEIGIILIMFAIGFEEQASHFVSSIRKSWGIALFGALAPFAAAYGVTWYFWASFPVSLMSGLTMTATAVSLTMVALRAEGLGTTKAATRIMTSAVLDDIASLALVAIMIPVAQGGAIPGVAELGIILAKVVMFFAAITLIGVVLFPTPAPNWAKHIPFINAIGIKQLLKFERGQHATLVLLLLAVVTGLLAHLFGFHPAVGAYMAGLILRDEYFDFHDDNTQQSYLEVKRLIDNIAFTWIGPVFFVLLGTKLVINVDIVVSLIPQTIALTLSILVAQVVSAALAARYTAGMEFAGSVMIGLGMLGRAELAFVVLDIAYVQNSILSDDAFYTLMFTAFWLNITVPLAIRWWKPKYMKELQAERR